MDKVPMDCDLSLYFLFIKREKFSIFKLDHRFRSELYHSEK